MSLKNGPYQKWLLHCGEYRKRCRGCGLGNSIGLIKTTFPETWKCKDPPELQIKAMDGDTPLLIHVQVYLARSNRIYIAHLFLLSQWFTRTWTLPICFSETLKPPKEKRKRESIFLEKRVWNVMKQASCYILLGYPVSQEAVDAALRTLNLPIREVVHLACWRSVGWWRGCDKRIVKSRRTNANQTGMRHTCFCLHHFASASLILWFILDAPETDDHITSLFCFRLFMVSLFGYWGKDPF